MTALLSAAASSPEAARMLREFLTRELFGRISEGLGVPDAELRAGLVAGQMVGVAFARFVVGLEPLASLPVQALVPWLAPTIQRYLTAPSPQAAAEQALSPPDVLD